MIQNTPDFYIQKENETYIKVLCADSLARELFDYFSFFSANYKFSPQYRNKVWDGKIRLFKIRKKLIYKGLFNRLIEWIESNGYTYQTDYVQSNKKIELDIIKNLFETINGVYTPKEHHLASLHASLRYQNCMVISPTASGKSFFIYNLANFLSKTMTRGLIIVPTINLVSQLKQDFIDYSVKNQWDVENNVHMIYGGQTKNTNKKISISTWQSIYDLPKKYFAKFDWIIVDEAHHATSDSIKKIMEGSINARFRIGTTGTTDGTELNELILEGLFGPLVNVISTKELMNRGDIAQLQINCMVMNHNISPIMSRELIKSDNHKQLEYLALNEKRNKFIRKIVANERGNKLVLFQFVEKHGIPLYEAFKKEYPDKEIYYISGITPLGEREEIRKRLSETNDAILVAGYQVYSTGMNVPSIQHVFSTMPGKSRIRILQTIGRALRLHNEKEKATAWDFADKIEYKGETTAAFKHFEKRLELYMKQQFTVKQYHISL